MKKYLNIINLINNKIVDKITKFSENLQQNDSITVTNENDQEIPKEAYISLEERERSIDNFRIR